MECEPGSWPRITATNVARTGNATTSCLFCLRANDSLNCTFGVLHWSRSSCSAEHTSNVQTDDHVSALLGSLGVDVAVGAIDVTAATGRALHVGRLGFGDRSHELERLPTISTDELVDWHLGVSFLKARIRGGTGNMIGRFTPVDIPAGPSASTAIDRCSFAAVDRAVGSEVMGRARQPSAGIVTRSR